MESETFSVSLFSPGCKRARSETQKSAMALHQIYMNHSARKKETI